MTPLSPVATAREQLPSSEEIRDKLRQFLSENTTLFSLRSQIRRVLALTQLPEIIVNEGVLGEGDMIIPRVISVDLDSQEYVVSDLFEEKEIDPSDPKKLEKQQSNIEQRKIIASKFLNRYLGGNIGEERLQNDLRQYLGYADSINIERDELGYIKKITIQVAPGEPHYVTRGYDDKYDKK